MGFNAQQTRLITRIEQLEQEVADFERRWRYLTGRDGTDELDRKSFYLDVLANFFTAEDLHTACYELGVDYETLPASSKLGKARELLIYMENRGRLPRLYEYVQEQRPFLFEQKNE